jgi:hypothetical protein
MAKHALYDRDQKHHHATYSVASGTPWCQSITVNRVQALNNLLGMPHLGKGKSVHMGNLMGSHSSKGSHSYWFLESFHMGNLMGSHSSMGSHNLKGTDRCLGTQSGLCKGSPCMPLPRHLRRKCQWDN